MTKDTKQIYTVTQLTRDIRLILEENFQEVWVEGEVSNFVVSSAGHAYFSLKDEKSLINCVLFKGNSSRLAFAVEDGLHVLCRGRISLYDKRGQYQLYVSTIEPRGKGSLQLAFEQLKEKLHKEGLFEEKSKKPLPFLPMRIGVVTSPTGAAIKDILKVVRRRFSNVEISICPVRVQGAEAKNDIVRAIEELNEFNRHIEEEAREEHPIDVIIVGRGGGSLEDLWPFNEEIVARAIFDSEIPVISAVGHEIDYTISDLVADFRAPTPSAAAELVIPLKMELAGRITEYSERLYLTIKKKINALQREMERLRDSYVLRTPMNVFLQLGQQVDDLAGKAASSMSHALELKRHELGRATGKLQVLSPLAVLERGYSITFKDGRVVKESESFKKGDLVQTLLSRGRLTSTVESVEK
ncbi:MAG: exodeoxyribonuclease VII large subunit [Candidatus Omnitrophota bacterium]